MTNVVYSSDLLARLRRSAVVGAVTLLAFSAVACGDDDDGPSGPSAACLDEIDDILDELNFDRDDIQALDVGDSRSAAIADSDLDLEGTLIDFFILELEDDTDVEITANPETGFDIALLLFDAAGSTIDSSDDPEDLDATESITAELPDGCFIVIVASASEEGDETGSYTIAVEE